MASKIVQCKYLSVYFTIVLVIKANNVEPAEDFVLNINEPEVIINATDNFTITCSGKKPITWSSPKTREESTSNTSIISHIPDDPSYPFKSSLHLENASYSDTGFYCCNDGNVEDCNDVPKHARLYLFVADDQHLSVSNEPVETVTGTQYMDAIIPCRPTSPDVRVTLHRLAGDVIENVSYSPQTGFKIYISELSQEDEYTCEFSKENESFERSLYLIVTPMTDSIAVPILEDMSEGHTVKGEPLHLKCSVKSVVNTDIEFLTPGIADDRVVISKINKPSGDLYYRELIINETELSDTGNYTCIVKDRLHTNNFTISVKIYDTNEHFINLIEENDHYSIDVPAGTSNVQWIIKVDAHPVPSLRWMNNLNETIEDKSLKYYFNYSANDAFIKINDITISDRGIYTLVASNKYEEQSLNLFLNVTDKPTVHLNIADYYLFDETNILRCTVAAYPEPSIFWFFKACQDDSCDFEQIFDTETERDGLNFISKINITTNNSGYLKCTANNSFGEDEHIAPYLVTDVSNGFSIWGLEDVIDISEDLKETTVAEGETIVIKCGASVFNYTDEIGWFKDSQEIENLDDYHYATEKSHTDYSYRAELTIREIRHEDTGVYSCRVRRLTMEAEPYKYINLTITVADPSQPIINYTNMDQNIELLLHEKLQLTCIATGIPKPQIRWYKDNMEFNEDGARIIFSNEQQIIEFVRNEVEDEGTYKCEAYNRVGSTFKEVSVEFKDKPGFNYINWILMAGLLFGLVITIIFYCIKDAKQKKLKRKLRIAGLDNFEKGALECLNPELRVDDQAELLPYDKKWEFPREKLKLGKQLGAGAFGVVMKAEARGIAEGEDTTTVAVKMVKRDADYTYIKALASELKIMVHLGKHLNVVNLLGACTKNVVKRELLVIVEYCRFGNLHNYLLRHRGEFINQIDPNSGYIDYTIGAEILERTFSISSDRSNTETPNVKYAALSFSNSSRSQAPEMSDYRANSSYSGRTTNTENTEVWMSPTSTDPKGEDGLVLSNNSVQPEWRTNYRGDYRGNVKPICTKDLLTWAFQVARGMEYLASRKVMHGDLAARNILLADENVVKICDFGLAKSMYSNDNYKKKGDGPLPVKWMAIESIRDRVFSTQSDVWSFGIVLWEFFSLARTPYPGMEADERLFQKLVDGYRMDSPEFSTKEIYSMMLDCWKAKPLARPSFTRLSQRIGSMLEDSVRKHYIDLNDPYLVMNTQRLENGQNDYLAMLSPPDFENISTPHGYVNDPQFAPPDQPEGYLCMKPAANIFSPREANENVFTFDVANRKQKDSTASEEVVNGELIPMLHKQESDCENFSAESYANPSYHVLSKNAPEAKNNILKSADNYVNMPINKCAVKCEDVLSNGVGNNPISRHYENVNVNNEWNHVQTTCV